MPPKKQMRTEDTHLVWTDDEVKLLSETTRDFKASVGQTGKHKAKISNPM